MAKPADVTDSDFEEKVLKGSVEHTVKTLKGDVKELIFDASDLNVRSVSIVLPSI